MRRMTREEFKKVYNYYTKPLRYSGTIVTLPDNPKEGEVYFNKRDLKTYVYMDEWIVFDVDNSDLDNAIIVLKEKFNQALCTEYINHPIAWALYQTWKEFDKKKYEK